MNMVGKSIRPALIILSAAVLLGLLAVLHSVPLAQTPSGLVAYRVIGSANLANPGSESFWSNIPWFNVTLSPTLSGVPTSGLVPYVEAKAAYNGDYIFILVKWPDNNPSTIGADSVAGPGHWIMVYNPKGPLNMTFLNLLTSTFNRHYKVINSSYAIIFGSPRAMEYVLYYYGPANGVYFYGYFTNATHYYPDRFAIMWYMGAQQNPSDCMNIGGPHPGYKVSGQLGQVVGTIPNTGGSLSSGAANIWEWIAGVTYPQGSDFNYFANATWDAENGINPTDASQFASAPHGFFLNLLTNQSGLFDIGDGGIWYPNATGPVPGYFSGYTGAKYENGYWVLEFVRQLKSPMPDTVNITVGSTYDIAFGVWYGKSGETTFDKSITANFVPLTLVSKQPAPPSAIPSVVLIVAVIGIIIALVAIGVTFFAISKRRK